MFIFVADLFLEHYVGGAELTFGAIVNSTPVPAQKTLSRDLSISTMEQHQDKFWIFGNYSGLSESCMMYAIKNLNYSIVEFDYKYCKYRTEHLHKKMEGDCDCHTTTKGKLTALFVARAKVNYWMSQGQLDAWSNPFPPLKRGNNFVLSSIFSHESLDYILSLDTTKKEDKWIILGSSSWIKGKEDGVDYAIKNSLDYEVVWGLEYRELLQKLASSKGLIQLPRGYDTCPRMVIEAKLLGCELVINDLVQHKDEEWFNSSREDMISYLRDRASFFWEKVSEVEEAGLPSVCADADKEKHFSVVIPAWNCETWVGRALNSVLTQNYKNYTVYFVDDASTDNTERVVRDELERFVEEVQAKVIVVKNEENKKALYNICKSIEQVQEDTIVVLLDGDDWFSTTNVLSYLNKIYSDEGTWLTTGSYVEFPTGRLVKSLKIPEHAWEQGVRKFKEPPGHPNIFSHLRTFKKSLFEKIDIQDLLDHDGEYYRCTFDRALMYPMIEMAGPNHHKIIDKAMYVYNTQNPRSVHLVDRQNQLRIEQELRDKDPYERVQL
jgi:hypothetical protein